MKALYVYSFLHAKSEDRKVKSLKKTLLAAQLTKHELIIVIEWCNTQTFSKYPTPNIQFSWVRLPLRN